MGGSQSVISRDEFKNHLYGTAVLMLSPRVDSELKFKPCADIEDDEQHVLPAVRDSAGSPKNMKEVIEAYTQYYGDSGKEEAIDKYVDSHILDTPEHLEVFLTQLISVLQDTRHRNVDTSVSLARQRSEPSQRRRLSKVSRPSQVQTAGSVHSSHVQPQRSVRSTRSARASNARPRTSAPVPPAPVPSSEVSERVPTPHPSEGYLPVAESSPLDTIDEDATPIVAPTPRVRGAARLRRQMNNLDHAIDHETAAYELKQRQEELLASTSQNIARAFEPVEYQSDGDVYDEESTRDGSVDDVIVEQPEEISSARQ